MSETEQLVVPLVAKIDDFERNFKRAGRTAVREFNGIEQSGKKATSRLETHMAGIGKRVTSIGKNMAAGFFGGLVAGGVMAILGRGGELARGIAEIGDEAKRAGLSFEAFQELKYVAEQNRIGVDSLTDGIKELNLRADEFIVTGGGSAAEAFKRLGYDADTLKTKLKDPSALFTEIIGKLGRLDRAAQIRIADEIFGGSGGEKFVQLIEQGEAGLKATKREAHNLGIILSDDVITKADELDRRFNALTATVGSGLKQAIVGASLALVDFINTFNSLPAMANLRASTAPLAERSLSMMQDQLASKDAALQRSMASPDTSGWFGTSIGVEGDQDALRTEISELTTAIKDRQNPAKFDVNSVFSGLAAPTFDSVDAMNAALAPPPLPTVLPTLSVGGGSGGGGGGASSMRDKADATKELIAELENELRALAMSDVEQRVNAELRKAGAGATDAQKANIRELVNAIDTETAAMAQMETAMNNAKGMAKDFLGGLLGDLRSGVDGATALANAFGNLANKLMDMALDALINSLFSNLMGGAGGGGLLGGLFGFSDGGAVKAATGGHIRGPGTGTSDSIPARLSDGEFVINAAATKRNLDLLHAINRGEVSGFAAGGLVGDSPSLRAVNDNIGHANDNAPVFQISAPITVNGSAGTPEQNSDLAAKMARQMEASMRGVVGAEIAKQMRPGNQLNSRSR